MNLILRILGLCSLICLGSGMHHQIGDRLYLIHPKQMQSGEANQFCQVIGGLSGHDLTTGNTSFLIKIRQSVGGCMWLNTSRSQGGYRWGMTGNPIDADLWLAGEPNCAGNCGAFFTCKPEQNKYGLQAEQLSTNCYPFCELDLTNDIQTSITKSKLSYLDPADRTFIETLLTESITTKKHQAEHEKFEENMASKLKAVEDRLYSMEAKFREAFRFIQEFQRSLSRDKNATMTSLPDSH